MGNLWRLFGGGRSILTNTLEKRAYLADQTTALGLPFRILPHCGQERTGLELPTLFYSCGAHSMNFIGYIPEKIVHFVENHAERSPDHWIVSAWQCPTDVRLQTNAIGTTGVSKSNLKSYTFVNVGTVENRHE